MADAPPGYVRASSAVERLDVHLLLAGDDGRQVLVAVTPTDLLPDVRLAPLIAAAALFSGCMAGDSPILPQADTPVFRPEVFFDGPSHGDPVLRIRTKGTQQLRVQSMGTAQADGTFRLDQTITYPDGHATERRWVMQALGGGRYTSTLTPDATGPVTAYSEGNRFHIRYPMGRMTTMEQTLALHPDGQVADNVATVRMGGMVIARITETITRGVE